MKTEWLPKSRYDRMIYGNLLVVIARKYFSLRMDRNASADMGEKHIFVCNLPFNMHMEHH